MLLSGNDENASLITGRRVCDPTGAVFNDTLEELNDIDRQLLLFSSSANLVAVRWLLGLGGNPSTRDMNGTTCLHAACRSGSPSVVETLINASTLDPNPLLNVDVSGWTPLHIAAFMGRHEVVTLLLKAGAPLTQRNFAGNTPSDLCSDARTREVINSLGQYAKERKFGPGMTGEEESAVAFSTVDPLTKPFGKLVTSARDQPLVTDQGHQYMRYEPFFVPRAPLISGTDLPHGRLHQLAEIGKAIFNHQPGRGLAFVVGCGCTRDYPIDLVAFLRGSELDPAQVGHFIGEAFSLSKILRLEFINSVTFTHTGVVSSLTKVFANFKVPADLRKIDRIVHSLAEVWWRQHERLDGPYPVLHAEGTLSLVFPGGVDGDAAAFAKSVKAQQNQELTGSLLRAALAGPEVLHQLLFSAMLLHWNLHAPLPESERLSMNDWLELNRGIATASPNHTGSDLPEEVLEPIYRALSAAEDPRLQIPVGNQLPLLGQPTPRPTDGISPLSRFAQVEGWARIIGSQVPVPPGLASQGEASTVSCVQMSNMLSEATDTSRRCRDNSNCQVQPVPHQLPQNMSVVNTGAVQAPSPPGGTPDAAWLVLCKSMLFIAAGPGLAAPFAFLHLRSVRLAGIEPGKNLITIDGGSAGFSVAKAFPLQLVFLLPDGRWQSFDIPQLEFEVCDRSQMEKWMFCLSEMCKGNADYADGPTKRSL